MARTAVEQIAYYRRKAEELRTMVEDMTHGAARQALLAVADEYDLLADKAAARDVRTGQIRR